MNWRVESPIAAPTDWPADPADLDHAAFLLAFVLTGDSSEHLPHHICGVQISSGRAVENDREYLAACMKSETPKSWFSPGFNALTVSLNDTDPSSAVRAGWNTVRPAGRFLSTYIRPPRPGLDLERQRIIEPTGWVLVSHHRTMALVIINRLLEDIGTA